MRDLFQLRHSRVLKKVFWTWSVDPLGSQFWCHRPSTELVWTFFRVIQKNDPMAKVWPSAPPKVRRGWFVLPQTGHFYVFFFDEINFPCQISPLHVHNLKANNVERVQTGYLGAILVHPMRRQNFAGKLHLCTFLPHLSLCLTDPGIVCWRNFGETSCFALAKGEKYIC